MSQPDPPTIGLSFSAMGALLVDAAASLTTSGSSPAELFPKPAASATPTIQLGRVPSEPSPQNRRLPDGVFGAFMTMNVGLSAASLCSGDLTLTTLVDSGATRNFIDPLLHPWLQGFMTDSSVLPFLHTIVTRSSRSCDGHCPWHHLRR